MRHVDTKSYIKDNAVSGDSAGRKIRKNSHEVASIWKDCAGVLTDAGASADHNT